jgi:hypothetical protein
MSNSTTTTQTQQLPLTILTAISPPTVSPPIASVSNYSVSSGSGTYTLNSHISTSSGQLSLFSYDDKIEEVRKSMEKKIDDKFGIIAERLAVIERFLGITVINHKIEEKNLELRDIGDHYREKEKELMEVIHTMEVLRDIK